jgi:prevent-host-death family protein
VTKKRSWQLQEAKNKLSEVIRCAREDGPQEITVRGEPAVVVVSAEEWEQAKPQEPRRPKETLYELLYDPSLPKLTEEEVAYIVDRDYPESSRSDPFTGQ